MFQITIPCPILRCTAIVSALTVGEHLTLHISNLSPRDYLEQLLKIVFDHVQFRATHRTTGPIPKSYIEFIQLPWYDFVMLLHGINIATYGYSEDVSLSCSKCGIQFTYRCDKGEIVDAKVWDHYADYRHVTHTVTFSGIDIDLTLPTIQSYLDTFDFLTADYIAQCLDKLLQPLDTCSYLTTITHAIRKGDVVVTQKRDIYLFYNELPIQHASHIMDQFASTLGVYEPSIVVKTKCHKCHSDIVYKFDFLQHLLVSIYRLKQQNETYKLFIDMLVKYNVIGEYTGSINDTLKLPYPLFKDVVLKTIVARADRAKKLADMSAKRSASIMGLLGK